MSAMSQASRQFEIWGNGADGIVYTTAWEITADGEPIARLSWTDHGEPVVWMANEHGPWWRRAWRGLRLIFGRGTNYMFTAPDGEALYR